MSRILFDGFDAPPVDGVVAVDIANDVVATLIGNALANPAALLIAPDITADFVGAVVMSAVLHDVFIPPGPLDPRVAVITHAT
jgi:hypothetical protein